MDKLQAMEVFVQVVDAGSFTRAADILQLPKATVSTLVSGLESHLSVKLLHRTTRQVSVTADGAAYYERCLAILNDVQDAEDALSRRRLSPAGRLRVDVPSGLGHNLIVPALPSFFERYPDIRLELGCSDRPVDLIEEGVDCVVRGGNLADSSLVARRIGVLLFVTCAAPSYLARRGMPQHPNDLQQHECINYFSSKTGKVYEWDFTREGQRIETRVPGSVAVNDSSAYLTAALAGLGIAQLPVFTALPHIEEGRLQMVLPEWCSEPLPLHVMYPQNRHLSAKVRAFVEWVSELMADHPWLDIRRARECGAKPGMAARAQETEAEPS